jgi:hypothetical protein
MRVDRCERASPQDRFAPRVRPRTLVPATALVAPRRANGCHVGSRVYVGTELPAAGFLTGGALVASGLRHCGPGTRRPLTATARCGKVVSDWETAEWPHSWHSDEALRCGTTLNVVVVYPVHT